MRLTGDSAFRGDKETAGVMEGADASGRNVLLKLKASRTALVGGKRLVVPDSVKQDLAWVIVAVGPKAQDAAGLDLEPGDRCVFVGGVKFVVGDETYASVDGAAIQFRLNREVAAKYFDGENAPAVLTSMEGGLQ